MAPDDPQAEKSEARRARLREVSARYEAAEDPSELFRAQMAEIIRNYAIDSGVCPDCIAKLRDPLAS